jgi:hypothetical protein
MAAIAKLMGRVTTTSSTSLRHRVRMPSPRSLATRVHGIAPANAVKGARKPSQEALLTARANTHQIMGNKSLSESFSLRGKKRARVARERNGVEQTRAPACHRRHATAHPVTRTSQRGERAATRLRALIDQGEIMLAEITCSCLPGTRGTWFCNWGRRFAVLTVGKTWATP